MVILALLLACADPELARYKEALHAWDQGKAALDDGDAAKAAERFGRVAELDPQSPTALAWVAVARERAGDAPGALDALDEGVSRFPDDVTLRYNRAAWHARHGEVQAAADDLRALYTAGTVDPLEVGEDPDFASVAADPATAGLAPPPSVLTEIHGEGGPVLIGENATIELDLSAKTGELVSITDMGESTGLLRLARIVEDVDPSDGRRTSRHLSVTWRTVAAGKVELGPWLVAAGGVSAITERVSLEVLALPGREIDAAPDEADTVRSLEALFSGHEAPWAGRVGGRVLVVLPLGARAEVQEPGGLQDPAPATLELRAAGQTKVLGELHRLTGEVQVKVVKGSTTILETTVSAAQ